MKSVRLILTTLSICALLICCSEPTAPETCGITPEKSHSTNPKILELRNSMISFRKSLSKELLAEGSTCLNSQRFYLWHNTPANDRGKRDGITYGDLDTQQLDKFKSVMKLFLSNDGYNKVNEITVLSEGWLSNIKEKVWNPSFYSIDMFGDPEQSGSWGFQLDGHHCVVNFLVHGDHVSIVPAFLGGEPAKANYNGRDFDIFKNERDLALNLFHTMTAEEKSSAVTKSSSRALKVGAAERPGKPDPYINDYDYSIFKKGLKYADMSDSTKNNLIILMKEYVYNLDDAFADVWWRDINENLDESYFVWIDDVDTPNEYSQFYYRIYNPYLWVEFNTEDVTGANANNMEKWNHIHTITRIPNNPSTKNGGDYGAFATLVNKNKTMTLFEHYAHASHHHQSELFFDYEIE